jgi:hypothetical protein
MHGCHCRNIGSRYNAYQSKLMRCAAISEMRKVAVAYSRIGRRLGTAQTNSPWRLSAMIVAGRTG